MAGVRPAEPAGSENSSLDATVRRLCCKRGEWNGNGGAAQQTAVVPPSEQECCLHKNAHHDPATNADWESAPHRNRSGGQRLIHLDWQPPNPAQSRLLVQAE